MDHTYTQFDTDLQRLRSASTSMASLVQSIERVGDHATNISEYVVTVVDGTDPRHSKAPAAVG